MNEPFLPVPLPTPVEAGYGRILKATALWAWSRLRALLGRLRRAPRAATRQRGRTESRLAARSTAYLRRSPQTRFPLLPPPPPC